MRVSGKVALVTGAANGIGKACATLLAHQGARVVVTDIDEMGGIACARELAAFEEGLFFRHDAASEADWVRIIERVRIQFGRLDIVVNNAGIGARGTPESTTLEAWQQTMRINAESVFLGVKYAIEAMKERGGSIVNISSVLGLVGDPGAMAYSASKGAVRLLTKSAALYCARRGYNIRVNSVHPGFIDTEMVREIIESARDPEAARTHSAHAAPLGRMGEPLDVAYGVLYLASDESKFVTGSELVIDGGTTAQ